jgi:hypothetical protein
MRYIFGVAIVGCVLQVVSAQEPAPPNQWNITRNDKLAGALWRIAAATHTRIGFEATDIVRISGSVKRIPPVSVSTLEDSLNTVVGADDRYEWRKVEDVVVVRPKGAWGSPSDPFNRPMRNLRVENAPLGDVVLGIRDFIYTGNFVITHRSSGIVPVSFQLRSGTVVDALNQLIDAADQALWIASYRPIGQPADRFPGWDLDLQVRDGVHLQSLSSSYPPARN